MPKAKKCLNDPTKTYQGTEPSPKGLGVCAHAERAGSVRTGRDGREWIVSLDKNKRRSWRPRPAKTQTQTATRRTATSRTSKGKPAKGQPAKSQTVKNQTAGVVGKFASAVLRAIGYDGDGRRMRQSPLPRPDRAASARTRRDPHRRGRLVWTHDNGTMAYAVYVSRDSTSVFGKPRDREIPDSHWTDGDMRANEHLYARKVGTFENFARPRVGRGSVLLQTGARTCVHVGWNTFRFELAPGERVVEFQSQLGNNDVALPVARTNEGRVLLLWDHHPMYAPRSPRALRRTIAGSFTVLSQAEVANYPMSEGYIEARYAGERESPPRKVGTSAPMTLLDGRD